MDIEYFRRLFRYDRWANQETLAALQAARAPSAKSIQLLAHLAGAGHTWLARVRPSDPPLAIWPELTLEQCQDYLESLATGWQAYLGGIDSATLADDVIYRNSKGEEFSTPVLDVLNQVLTHGAYHRGQIAAELRACGDTPAATDFILAARKQVL